MPSVEVWTKSGFRTVEIEDMPEPGGVSSVQEDVGGKVGAWWISLALVVGIFAGIGITNVKMAVECSTIDTYVHEGRVYEFRDCGPDALNRWPR